MIKKHFYLVLIILAVLTNCKEPKQFILIKQSAILNLDLENSVINFIPIPDNDLKTYKILDSTYSLIKNKKFDKLDTYLNSLDTTLDLNSDFYLSKTLYYITQNEYEKAAEYVELMDDADFQILKKLLTIDISFELSLKAGTYNFYTYLQKYQELYDFSNEDPSIQKILLIRVRHLRHYK